MQDEMKPQVQQPQVDSSEGQMARADLYRGAKNAMKLFQMVQDGQQLEGWVQAKITKAADYLDSVYHYMEYQAKFGQGGVAISLDDITSDAAVSGKQGAVSEEDDEKEIKESMNYEQKLRALLEGAKKKMKPAIKDEKVKEGKTEVQYDKDGKRTGVKHTSTHKYSDEPHTEPKSQVKGKSAAEKAGDKAADKQQAKDSKDYEKKNPGSVKRYKDGKLVSEDADSKKAEEEKRKKEDKKKKMAKIMDEGARPDYADIDDDGDEKETMKDAAADKKAGPKKDSGKKGMSDKQAKYFGKKNEGFVDTVKSAVGIKKKPLTTAEKNAEFHAANKNKRAPITKGDVYDPRGADADAKYDAANAASKQKVKESVTESADLSRMRQLMKRLNG
jgi:hypothetical protein